MPYPSFHPNRPVGFSSKSNKLDTIIVQLYTLEDKLADWFEYHAGLLEPDVWTGTIFETLTLDENFQQ